MEKRKGQQTRDASSYEGRDQYYVDIDRMINEGLSGGSVHARHNHTNIEEARDLPEEQPPVQLD